ncbi:MAG: glycosyltransferase family 2 protein [Treponemataceae bacterium]|nr:glycosyltransferase family 2 protein [Treponemataceae bacterium]
MKDKVTVIITIRNREAIRIERQVESIRKYGADPTIHVVDYGSDHDYATAYKNLCEKLGIQYTHLYAEGLPWNKCRAINYGVIRAKTPFIVTSDVDMIYEDNPFQWCLDNYEEKSMFHIETYWLNKNGDRKNASYAGHGNSGGFQFIRRDAFIELGGYDERIEYWGYEDLDWPERLKTLGYKQIWLPEKFKLFHVWHEKVSDSYNRPNTIDVNSLSFCLENLFSPTLKKDVGVNLEKTDRPILDYIDKQPPYLLCIDTNDLSKWAFLEKFVNEIKSHEFIKLQISPRLKKRPLDFLRERIKSILKPITALTGTKVISNINKNFDFFYEYIPILKRFGLRDYYISNNSEVIYLLWKKELNTKCL